MPISPIIPIPRPDPFDDPAYLYELKYDGFRGLADTLNGSILSKNKNRMKRFETLLETLGFVFDGERPFSAFPAF
jgi:ATP-dependent DNA ligase